MKNKLIFILFPFLLMMSGCQKKELSELKKEIEAEKTGSVGFVPETTKIPPPVKIMYSSSGLKSPFRNSISEIRTEKKTLTEIKPDLNREKSELETYPLNSLSMLGTINAKKDSDIQAILNTNKGKVFIVGVGDYIGKNNGRIKEITESTISLEEIIPNGSYRWVKRPATIFMLK